MWGRDQQFHSVFPLDVHENTFYLFIYLFIYLLDYFIFKGILLNFTE